MVFKLTQHKIFAVLCILLILVSLIMITPTIKNNIKKNQGTKLPIITYHLEQDEKKSNDYIITPQQFENDLKYIKEKGYTTITMTELINHCLNDEELPKHPIIISFDDGFKSIYTYAYPLLKKYDMCAVVSIVGSYTDHFTEVQKDDTIGYSYLDWYEIEQLSKNNIFEFQNHSYNMHSKTGNRIGIQKMYGENEEQYRNILIEDIGKMQNLMYEKTGFKPNTFVYPFGYNSEFSKNILKEMGFTAALTCEEHINIINDSIDLMELGRFKRPNDKSSEEFFEDIF